MSFLVIILAIPKVCFILNSTKGMVFKINNTLKNFDCKSLTIQELLDFELHSKQNGIAVAVNQTVVSKNQWATFLLTPLDDILIITATQGG